MSIPMSSPQPAAVQVQPQRRQKIRPFSFMWGVIFLAVGSTGFASGSFGFAPGPVFSFTFVVCSCVALYLILRERRLVNAIQNAVVQSPAVQNLAGTNTATTAGQAVSGHEDELYRQALAELDSVDYTITSPEQILTDDSVDPGEASGSATAD